MTPLVLLVGFLGAGKTTLMRDLVPRLVERGLRPHVVINDYQNARVDASYFQGLAEAVAPINGSCVCCESFADLIATLDAQELDERSVLLLESNGTTDSVDLVEQLSLRPELRRYTMPVQISVIDAKRWQRRFWHSGLERDQVTTASYLFLTRTDEIAADKLEKVRGDLRGIVPQADFADGAALAEVLAAVRKNASKLPQRREKHAGDSCCGSNHGHHHHHDEEGMVCQQFASWECALPPVVDAEAFRGIMAELPDTVLRAKGVVRLSDAPDQRLIFQKVAGGEMLATPLDDAIDLEPMAIFVGPAVPMDDVRERMAKL